MLSCSAISDSLWSHGLQLTRFLCPGDFPGKNTRGVATSSSRGSSWLRDRIQVSCISCIGSQILYHWTTWKTLYVLDSNCLLYRYLLNMYFYIFSHSAGCLFIFLWFPLLRKNLTSDQVPFVFVIISIFLGDWPKKMLVQFMLENVLPVMSSRSSIVSCLIFKSKSLWVYFCAWCDSVYWLHWFTYSCLT